MSKEKDLKFIKGFIGISLSSICRELNVDRQNIIHGKSSPEKTKLVKEAIIKKISEL